MLLLPVAWRSHVFTEGFGHPGGTGVGGRVCARVSGQPGYRGTQTVPGSATCPDLPQEPALNQVPTHMARPLLFPHPKGLWGGGSWGEPWGCGCSPGC